MLDTWLNYSIILFITLSFLLGIFSLYKNPKSFTVWVWVLFLITVIYTNIVYLLSLKGDSNLALLYSRLLHIGVPFISVFLFHFVLALIYKHILPFYKLVVRISYCIAILLASLALTPWIINDVFFGGVLSTTVVIGPLYPLLLVYIFTLSIWAIFLLFKEYRGREGAMRRQIFYIFLGVLVSFLGSLSYYLPQLFNIYPYGNFLMWTFPIFVTYGVFIEEVKISFN